jgi:hypothetical protein
MSAARHLVISPSLCVATALYGIAIPLDADTTRNGRFL